MKSIIIFASGSGSNAEKIMQFFDARSDVNVSAIFTNKSDAGVILKAKAFNVPTFVINRESLNNGEVLKRLLELSPDLIVLAGFLLQFPADIIAHYPGRIINIHPALLPKYGGKGMYGMNVHQAVSSNRDKESGITIHYVDEHYDNGDVILQERISLEESDSCEMIAAKVQQLEHKYLPIVIDQLLNQP